VLSKEDNELITRVGPGTPMGNLMREYWMPAMLSSELPKPGCSPVRVMLLGEKLIGFRDGQNQVGLLADAARTVVLRCFSAETTSAACAASTTAGSST